MFQLQLLKSAGKAVSLMIFIRVRGDEGNMAVAYFSLLEWK